MYFNGTKCQLFVLSCFMSASLLAKDVKTTAPRGLEKPLCFVENKGQVLDDQNHSRADVQFKMATKGLNLFVGNAQLHYQFKKVEDRNNAPFITSYPMDVTLIGANQNAKVSATEELDYYENYFLPQTGNEGITAHAYNKITYSNVYPNIDWVLYVKDGSVEYDFVVRPGGNAKDIKVKYSGATALSITKDGGILAKTPMGEVAEKQPYAYETATGKKVSSRFSVHDNVVSFETGKYNGTLTIDPYLRFCTYLGGGNDDVITSVKVAPNTPYNTFVCGYTSSNTGFTTGGVYQTTYGTGAYDAFFARYTAAGALSFCTYFGGTGADQAFGIITSASGNTVYVTGNTTSTASIASGGFAAYQGGGDIFAASFNNTGTTRNWGRYLGGTALDQASSIVFDASSSTIYIGGNTYSSTGISLSGSTSLSGTQDGYMCQLSGTTGTRIWSEYFGGSGNEQIDAIAVDASSSISAVGMTNSVTGIATSTAEQAVIGSASATDGFLLKVNGGTGAVTYGTYIGGNGADRCYGVATGNGNTIYVTGTTSSSDSIIAGIPYQASFGGGPQDGFLQKYTSGGALTWGTYLGGNSADYANAVNVDMFQNVVVAGYTLSTSGIATSLAYQTSNAGGIDAFISKFTPVGQNLYSTYFGGTGNDIAYGVSTDPVNSSIVFGGSSTNATGFTSTGAQQATYGGGTHDGFLARFLQDTIVMLRQGTFTDTLICSSGTFIVRDTTLTNFATGNTFSVELSDASGSFASPVTIGTSSAISTGSITCTLSGVTPGTGYRIRIVASNPAFISPDNNVDINVVAALPATTVSGTAVVCQGQAINLNVTAPYAITAYNWSGPASFSSALRNPTVTTSATTANAGTYTVTTSHNGCNDISNTFNVTVNTYFPPAPTDSSNSPVCSGSPIRLYANPGMSGTFSYYWVGPGGFTSTDQNPVIPAATAATAGTYYVMDTLNRCPSAFSAPLVVTINPLDTPNITISVSPNDTVCKGTVVNFTSTNTYGGYSPTYQWLSGPTTPIVGAVYDHYSTSTFSLGTAIRCVMRSNITCPDKPYDTSNVIYMNIIDNTPVITISATPDTLIARGTTVTFHAIVAGYNLLPGTWYVNNVPVLDSTTTLVLPNVTRNDTVRYEVASSSLCASIGVSNTVVVHVTTDVANVSSSFINVEMLPNPNNGSFAIKGLVGGMDNGPLSVQVTNAIGQVVYNGNAAVANGVVDSNISLNNVPAGMYMLHIGKDGASKVFRFVVN